MFDAGVNAHSLRDCLALVPPVELKGMALLRGRRLQERRPHGQFFPQLTGEPDAISREDIAEAVSEIVAYTRQCYQTVQQLANLAPIPLTAFSILEYGI